MTVLKIIGVFIFMWLVYFFIKKINSFSFKKYKYGFFSSELFFLYCLIYALLLFGYILYTDAVKVNGDILNGILLFAFGVILLAIRLVILMLILLIASQIKPVFNVNSK
jgi:hypothetical protein